MYLTDVTGRNMNLSKQEPIHYKAGVNSDNQRNTYRVFQKAETQLKDNTHDFNTVDGTKKKLQVNK